MNIGPGALPYTYLTITAQGVEPTVGGVVEESRLTIFVNGQELATLMCSPTDQEALAVGFLYTEGVIRSLDDLRLVRLNAVGTAVDIFLRRDAFEPPRRVILTSGCGRGVTFQRHLEACPPLNTHFAVDPEVVFARMRDLKGAARLYNAVRGVHTSVLATPDEVLLMAEDVGRHNTMDKLAGKALLRGLDPSGCLVLTSGRISSEMLNKARQMNIPLIASHTSPTSLAVQLAQAWNMCVIGYVRQGSLRVYTHPERLNLPECQIK